MSYKRLGKAISLVLAASLAMQTTVVYAAEDVFFCDETFAEDDYLMVEDIDDLEDSDDNEAQDYYEDIDETEDIEVIEAPEEEYEDEIADAEDSSSYEIFDEDIAEDIDFCDEEISVEPEQESSEIGSSEPDVSGNDDLDENNERNAVTASSNSPVNKVEIYPGIDDTAANTSYYVIKCNKNGTLKSAALTLGTSYTSMEIKAVQKRKDGTQSKDTPSWESKNTRVATVSGKGSTVTVKAVGKGKTSIICRAGDGSGKHTEITIEVRQQATGIEITGQAYITPGQSASYKANPIPSNSNNKGVVWTTKEKVKGVGFSKGKLKVDKTVKAGTKITLVAESKNIPGITKEVKETKVITVVDQKTTNLTLNAPKDTTISTTSLEGYKTSIELAATTDSNRPVSWKASKSGIVKISETGNNKVTVTGLASGTVDITANADDGSNKKKSVKVTVFAPVSSLELTVPNGRMDDYLALGCSLKFSPDFGDTKTKPSNPKLKWDYEIVGFDSKQEKRINLSNEVQQLIKKNKYFFTLKQNGTLKAKSQKDYDKQTEKLWKQTGAYQYAVIVKATTTDGTNITAQKLVKRVRKNPKLTISQKECSVRVNGTNTDIIVISSIHGVKQFSITYSNPDVAYAWVDSGNQVWVKGLAAGTTKITFTAMDGTKLKQTLTVRVN